MSLTLDDFQKAFPHEDHALLFLYRALYGENEICGRCKKAGRLVGPQIINQKTRTTGFVCIHCGYTLDPLAGSPFEVSEKKLYEQFFEFYEKGKTQNGLSPQAFAAEVLFSRQELGALRVAYGTVGAVLAVVLSRMIVFGGTESLLGLWALVFMAPPAVAAIFLAGIPMAYSAFSGMTSLIKAGIQVLGFAGFLALSGWGLLVLPGFWLKLALLCTVFAVFGFLSGQNVIEAFVLVSLMALVGGVGMKMVPPQYIAPIREGIKIAVVAYTLGALWAFGFVPLERYRLWRMER